ncbi:HIT family protein [Filibacter tadaridae]|uniref:HIT-like protein n=1 Tax=Filibacter tadaridae TaxID=2483811 RepID=A0A3P5XBQ9_9BACL|nr:HIT family protein [Filibacter tadaridae]VDC25889.1 HIT-like protein [Filibacter tadaridae]
MTSCIFCKIIEGSIPSVKVYEDEHVFAFMDIMPVTKGHVLLIPKTHRENVYDLTEDEASNLFAVAPKIARALKEEFKPVGMNLLQNNGAFAGQSVFHFHLHFIPRFDETDGIDFKWDTKESELGAEQIQEIAKAIQSNLVK